MPPFRKYGFTGRILPSVNGVFLDDRLRNLSSMPAYDAVFIANFGSVFEEINDGTSQLRFRRLANHRSGDSVRNLE